MRATILRAVLAQAAWLITAASVTAGWPWLGPGAVLLIALGCVIVAGDRGHVRRAVLAGTAAGVIADGLLIAAGVLQFPDRAGVPVPPVWMIALWINLALVLDVMAWVRERWWLGALAGGVGGPLSYQVGERLGILSFGVPATDALALIALEWAIALPALLLLVLPPRPSPSPAAEARA
jgi:hypothetical protein